MEFNEAFFDRGVDRRNTLCEKWDDRGVMAAGGIPLWVADMDFACAPAITEAIRRRAEHPCYGYNKEDPEDEEALRGFWLRRHQLLIRQGSTVMLPCVVTGLKACVRAFTEPGDSVAFFTPVYGPFYDAVRLNGRKLLRVPLIRRDSGRYDMNLAGMEEALKGGAKLILLCSPHNPVSRLWREYELGALCRLAAQYGVPVVCDEIHADFVYGPERFTSILSLPQGRERTVMLCAASKTFNVAGLQQAAAVCENEEMRDQLKAALRAAGVECGNTFARAATKAAYTACDSWLDGLIAYLDGNRGLLSQWLKEALPEAVVTPVESTYLAWLDLRAYGKTCLEMAEKCRLHGVALTGGTFFGQEGEGFMRLNFACPRGMLKEGVARLQAAMEDR